jgi:hypothetical protein
VAVVDATAVEAANLEKGVLQRELSVIGHDGIGSVVNPPHQFVLRGLRQIRVEIYVDSAAAHFQ